MEGRKEIQGGVEKGDRMKRKRKMESSNERERKNGIQLQRKG